MIHIIKRKSVHRSVVRCKVFLRILQRRRYCMELTTTDRRTNPIHKQTRLLRYTSFRVSFSVMVYPLRVMEKKIVVDTI